MQNSPQNDPEDVATILHVDMNAFFASCEQVRHPELRGKPVIVGMDAKRSVVSAASYEARKYGIHSAQPAYKAKQLCPHAVFLPVDMNYYAKVSAKVFGVLQKFAYKVEKVGIDEAFIDVKPAIKLFGTPSQIASSIIEEVLAQTGIKCCVGIGRSKSVAKLASSLAKPTLKDGASTGIKTEIEGVLEIKPSETEAFLNDLPVRKLYGVGPKTALKLRDFGVSSVRQIFEIERKHFDKAFGATTTDSLLKLAKGEDYSEVNYLPTKPKSTGREVTLPKDTRDLLQLKVTLIELAKDVEKTLLSNAVEAHTVSLVLKTNDHARKTRSRKLTLPTTSGAYIAKVAYAMLEKWFEEDSRPLRLIGISC
jgi:DNA polymerase-4